MKQSELYDAIAESLGVSVPVLAGVAENKTPPPAAAPLRILLAEDSLANQKLAIGLLSKWGHQVTLATNGCEAVATATSGVRFDLVLMDVQMPEMDGFEATQKIRQFEHSAGRPRVPIVAMTAHAMKGDRERCFEAGMDAYISKPVRAAELSRTISQFVPGERPSPLPAEQPDAAAAGTSDPRSTADIDWSVALENVGGDRDLLRVGRRRRARRMADVFGPASRRHPTARSGHDPSAGPHVQERLPHAGRRGRLRFGRPPGIGRHRR